MLFPGATVGGGRVVNLGLSFSSHIFARLAGGHCARKEESSFRLLGIQGRCTRSALVRSDEDTMTRAKPLQVASLGLLHVCGFQAWCMHLPPELGERPKGPHLSCLDEVFFHVPFGSASMFCPH